jgi:hypothetical protein
MFFILKIAFVSVTTLFLGCLCWCIVHTPIEVAVPVGLLYAGGYVNAIVHAHMHTCAHSPLSSLYTLDLTPYPLPLFRYCMILKYGSSTYGMFRLEDDITKDIDSDAKYKKTALKRMTLKASDGSGGGSRAMSGDGADDSVISDARTAQALQVPYRQPATLHHTPTTVALISNHPPARKRAPYLPQ